jgi:hypothetical protein
MEFAWNVFGGLITGCVIYALLSWDLRKLFSCDKLRVLIRGCLQDEMKRFFKSSDNIITITDPDTGERLGTVVKFKDY